MKVFLKIIKYILLAALVIMLAALAYVLISERDPAAMTELTWTDGAVEAYKESPNGFLVKSITGFDGRTYSQDGAIGISDVVRVLDLDEFQMLVRYNDSTLKEISEKRGEVDYPDTERFIFTVTDDLGNVYTDYHFVTAETRRHNYVRLVFDGIPTRFTKTEAGDNGEEKKTVSVVGEMQLNVYFREDVKDGKLPETPAYYVYIYSKNAAQYKYKNLDKELPGDKATEGIRSSDELYR